MGPVSARRAARWSALCARVPPSRAAFLRAAAAKRLLDRAGIGDARPVAWAARVARRPFARTGPDGAPAIRVRDGAMTLTVPERLRAAYVNRAYEPLTTAWLTRAATPGMTAVDVGAHVGWFTLLLARLAGPRGRVYAVEPAAENLAYLRLNVAANAAASVEVLPLAAAGRRGRAPLRLTESSDSHGLYAHPQARTDDVVEVETAPLDELVPAPLDLVKIDVEGAELDVLAGMERLLESSPDVRLVVEWNPACLRGAGREPGELPSALDRLGFDLVVLDEALGTARPVADVLAELSSGELPPLWYGNLAGVRRAT